MGKLLLVGAGGFVGSVLRYLAGSAAAAMWPRGALPVGTLIVNVLGCLAIGVASQLAETRSFFTPEIRALVIVGVLGGFTTFSAFADETLRAAREGAATLAVANVILNVTLCLAAVWVGRALTVYATQ